MLDEMRMRTACFARAPQRCTSRLSRYFLLTFQEVTPLSKTRNQLLVMRQPWNLRDSQSRLRGVQTIQRSSFHIASGVKDEHLYLVRLRPPLTLMCLSLRPAPQVIAGKIRQ